MWSSVVTLIILLCQYVFFCVCVYLVGKFLNCIHFSGASSKANDVYPVSVTGEEGTYEYFRWVNITNYLEKLSRTRLTLGNRQKAQLSLVVKAFLLKEINEWEKAKDPRIQARLEARVAAICRMALNIIQGNFFG